jgi:membrane protein implicated in regulation of membrane protease activity
MTISSPKTASLPGWKTDPAEYLARLILAARAVVAAERIGPALWPALGFPGIYLALGLFGLLALLPWTLQALLLAATITATGLALEQGLREVRWPSDHDGARRLEQDSGLKHRPISESNDRVIGSDPFALNLWAAHRSRALPLDGLRVALPQPDFRKRDPRSLRFFVLLALAAGLVAANRDAPQRLMRAFDSGVGAGVTIDAWVDPPPYTGLAPIYLTGSDVIAVPAGSTLNLRAHGAAQAPGLSLGDGTRPGFDGGNGEYAGSALLAHDAHVRVRAAGHIVGDWNVRVIPDTIPTVSFGGAPARTEHDATAFRFSAHDDYGVTSVRAVLTPTIGGASLTVDLPLGQTSKNVAQTTYVDLTANPYAGLMVKAVLEARDAAGQVGRSSPVTFRLPARVFTDPLGRALIEQRQALATGGFSSHKPVADMLDALAIAPERFYAGKEGLYLALRTAAFEVRAAHDSADIDHVEQLLWQIAVALEQNGLLDAAAQLRQVENLLTQAMASGAPQDVIDALLQKYNEAMQRYIQALQANPGAAAPPMQSGGDTKTITDQDIQQLLKAIQDLSASGNRQQAAQMLALLQQLLENLHLSQGGAGSGNGNGAAANDPLNQAIRKFGDMMGQQRGLLDKTMRQRQGSGDPKDGGAQGLSRSQGDLKNQLDQVMKGLDPKSRQLLEDAGKAMQNAQKALGGNDLDNAGAQEQQALDALAKGAAALAKQAQGSAQGQGNQDPLGRNAGGGGANIKLPGTADLARAREILQELRKRAGERGRPQQELDYIDRLLKEF